MACGGPDDEFDIGPSGSEYYEATSARDEARLPTDSEIPQEGTLDFLLDLYDFVLRWEVEFSEVPESRRNDIQWMRKWIQVNSTDMINYKFSQEACKYLCQNYASKEQVQQLIDNNWNLGFMFNFIDILLMNCEKLSKVCDHPKESESARSSPRHVSEVGKSRIPFFSKTGVDRSLAYQTPIPLFQKARSLRFRTPKEPTPTPLFQQTEAERSVPHQTPQSSRFSTPKSTAKFFSKSLRRLGVRSPFQKKHTEQRIDETPQRKYAYFESPIIRERLRYGFPPTDFDFENPTSFSKTIALSSPKREEPVLVNIAVDPKPLIDTERGERFVCDVAINVQPGGNDMLPQTPQAIGGAIPFQLDTSATTSPGRMPELGATPPVIKRGRLQKQRNVTSPSSGLFTPTVHKSPRRRRIQSNEANILEDRHTSSSRTTTPPYDPSTVNEAKFLHDKYFSPDSRSPRSP